MAKKISCQFEFKTIEVPPCRARIEECRSMLRIMINTTKEELLEIVKAQVGPIEDAMSEKSPEKGLQKVAKNVRQLRIFVALEKLDGVVKLVQESTAKTILFCSNRDVMVLLQQLLKGQGAQSIYGGSDPFTLEKSVNKFNAPKGSQVLVCDVRGFSSFPTLNASRVIFIDPEWDVKINADALKHCFGSLEKVNVDFISLKESIDSYVIDTLAFATKSKFMPA